MVNGVQNKVEPIKYIRLAALL